MWRDPAFPALVGFEVRRGLARPGARLGLILFTIILALGHVELWFDDGAATLFVEASCVGLIGLLSYGLAEDRRRAFDRYLIRNHVEARTYLLAKAAAMIALVLIGAAIALGLKLAFSGANGSEALWMTAFVALVGLMIAPAAMLIEGYVDTTLPAAFVVLGYPVLAGLAYMATETLAPFEWLGFTVLETGDWASLGPMALRTLLGVAPGFLVSSALIHLRMRRY